MTGALAGGDVRLWVRSAVDQAPTPSVAQHLRRCLTGLVAAGLEDLSRLMGHSSTRVTQDVYIHVRDDMYDRFYEATT